MSTTELRRKIKKAVDQLPAERLASVADFVAFLRQPTLKERLGKAEKDFAAAKGVNWRRVRDDV